VLQWELDNIYIPLKLKTQRHQALKKHREPMTCIPTKTLKVPLTYHYKYTTTGPKTTRVVLECELTIFLHEKETKRRGISYRRVKENIRESL
jgi:hypothetical protein